MFHLALPILMALAPAATDGSLVTMKGQRFTTEVCTTPEEHARGMMGRTSMARDQAMFFLYEEEGSRPIWMKNCLISLDVIWVKDDGTILETAEACPPCSPMLGDACPTYGGKAVSRHFIEFPSGTLKRLKVKKGDRIGWDLALPGGTRAKGGSLPGPGKTRK